MTTAAVVVALREAAQRAVDSAVLPTVGQQVGLGDDSLRGFLSGAGERPTGGAAEGPKELLSLRIARGRKLS